MIGIANRAINILDGRRLGRLIVFEGPNGIGKTTISEAFARRLNDRGSASVVYSFPGRNQGSLGEHIYRLHHSRIDFGVEEIEPSALQALHLAAHLDAIERYIIPKMLSGINVILDRYWWSIAAYGLVAGVPDALLAGLIATERIAWRGFEPSLLVVLQRGLPVSSSKEGASLDMLHSEYKRLVGAANNRHPVRYVDNSGTIEQTIYLLEYILSELDMA